MLYGIHKIWKYYKKIKMRIKNININNSNDFETKVTPLLIWEVFHITSESNYKKILENWYIKSGLETNRPHSYFYNKLCISFFDLRPQKAKKWETIQETFDFWRNCYQEPKWTIVAMLLTPDKYNNIVEPEDDALEKWLIIPYIEVWYQNKIYLNDIYKIIIINRSNNKPKLGSLSRIHDKANKNQNWNKE